MLELKNISKTYRSKNGVTHRALNDVSLSFGETGLVFIVGRSGGGKSTLLNIIAALDKADRGDMLLYGNSFKDFSSSKLDSYRNTYIGVVFQDYNLLPTLTVYQNIALALGLQSAESDERVNDVIDRLGLNEIKDRRPNEISGGQSQRVAIARALVKDPKMILADEPTGNLDSKTGHEMFDIFKKISKEKLVIIVTHDREIADEAGDRVIEIKDGRIHKDLIRTTELYEPAIDTVGDSLVRVPKGKHLDGLALEEINAILSKTERDTYIINEDDTAKVKSMNIHVKNAVELNQSDNATYYFPYRPEPEQVRPVSFIKSKMPLSVGFRLSLSMLKYKKFRLVITIIMLILALFLSAAVGVFKFYNFDRAAAKTVVKEKYGYILTAKAGDYTGETEFDEEDIKRLQNISGEVHKVYPCGANIDFIRTSDTYRAGQGYNDLFTRFYGIVETEGRDDFGFEYTAGSDPEEYGDAVISKLAAYCMLKLNVYKNAESYEDLIGREFYSSDAKFKICGIYETDTGEYDKAKAISDKEGLSFDDMRRLKKTKYYSQITEFDGFLFVKPGYTEHRLQNMKKVSANVLSLNGGKTIEASYVSPKDEAGELIYNSGDDGGVYISRALYSLMFGDFTFNESVIAANLSKYNENKVDCLIRQSADFTNRESRTSLVINGLRIAGVAEGEEATLYLNKEDFHTFASDSIPVNMTLIRSAETVAGNERLIKSLKAMNAYPKMAFYSDYVEYKNNLGLLSDIFTRALIMISIAAALLLFSFVSSSIRMESRQIGILRGMGARGIDTFKAFGIEGAVITAFSLILTSVLMAVLFPVINLGLSKQYAYHFYSMVINPYAVIFIILTAVLITAAAVTIPLIRLSKMTPVKAMTKNETQR